MPGSRPVKHAFAAPLMLGLLSLHGCGAAPSAPLRSAPRIREAPPPLSDSGPVAVIRFPVTKPGEIIIRIMDKEGRQVRDLSRGTTPGVNEISWDGMSDDGRRVGSGVYFVVVDFASGERFTTRVVLAR